jgi:surfactin synthase thioesterase subunit
VRQSSHQEVELTRMNEGRPWLLRAPGEDALALLFCLPYTGGGASMYYQWPRRFEGIEVCPVQFPGRENRLREPAPFTYDRLANDIAEALLPFLDRPFGFFGHCGSAIVGLETAAAIAERGHDVPGRVFASAMVSPDRYTFPRIRDADGAALAEVVNDMARARGVEVNPELADMALDVMRADVAAYRRYRPGPTYRYKSDVTVIGWQGDGNIPSGETGGWEPYGAIRRVVLSGDHWSFLAAPAALQSEIARDMVGARWEPAPVRPPG